jgi:hypothetical protein
MKGWFALAATLVAFASALISAPAAEAKKPVGGSFTTALTIGPTQVGTATISGTLTANVTRFAVDEQGHVVGIATLSGSVTVTEPTLGTGTIDVTGTRLVLTADVDADCEGHLDLDFRAVLQLRATVTLTTIGGITTQFAINQTVPLGGSVDFTAETQAQRALICEIATLLGAGASPQELVEKLNVVLRLL